MQAAFPIAITPAAEARPNIALTSKTALRQFFRPGVLAYLILALTVGGWSYGYKLSQYLLHPDVSRASHTRMWVEHRDDSLKAASHSHRPHTLPISQTFDLSICQFPPLASELASSRPLQSRILTFVSPLHPLRAPPVSHSSMA